ncbi:MAG: serine/threonine protein kinase, partial [Gemmataceae bacterium]|nr:serine/threonine protein kinase [Gemmataceae bacterium]
MIGQTLGNWTLETEVGSGAMGTVYRASGADGRTAAVKILAPELTRDDLFLSRFNREIEALRRLDHPQIVKYFDSGSDAGRVYLAIEFVGGGNYDERLRASGRLHWREVLEVARQVSQALKHAHDRGIIHRDLKPANLLLATDPDGPDGVQVKLADFGVAKLFAATQLTAAGSFVGTAAYLAPEQAAGKPPTKRGDLYSLGCVMYALITGRPPFPGKSIADVLHQHRYAQPEQPIRLVPDLPHDINAIVLQLMDKDPSNRPADASVLIKMIERTIGKLERQGRSSYATEAGGELDSTLMQPIDADSAADDMGPGPATFAARFVRDELERLNRGGPIARFFNHPATLFVMLMLCIGGIVYGIMRPHAPVEDAPAAAGPESADEYARARVWARVRREAPASEAERLYRRGLRQLRVGDRAGAKRTREAMVAAFADVESEKRWVTAGRSAIDDLASLPLTDRAGFDAAL